jgi:myo-inositol-1-phosphate synthase
MFCTKCHTVFDWTTGKIETGRIHNPHYYEFIRQNRGPALREPGDVRCGGVVNINTLREALFLTGVSSDTRDNIMQAYRATVHNRAIVLPRYLVNDVGENTHRDLRIKYLSGKIDDKKWLSLLKKREKEREKKKAVSMVLTMFVDTVEEIFNNMSIAKNGKEIEKYVLQIEDLKIYANDCLLKLAKRFNNQIPKISKDWDWSLVTRPSRK